MKPLGDGGFLNYLVGAREDRRNLRLRVGFFAVARSAAANNQRSRFQGTKTLSKQNGWQNCFRGRVRTTTPQLTLYRRLAVTSRKIFSAVAPSAALLPITVEIAPFLARFSAALFVGLAALIMSSTAFCHASFAAITLRISRRTLFIVLVLCLSALPIIMSSPIDNNAGYM